MATDETGLAEMVSTSVNDTTLQQRADERVMSDSEQTGQSPTADNDDNENNNSNEDNEESIKINDQTETNDELMDLPANNDNNNTDSTAKQDTKSITSKHVIQRSLLTLDGPTIFAHNDEQQIETKFFNDDVRIRLTRWSFTAFLPMIFLAVITYYHHVVELSILLGIMVEMMYVTYFAQVGYLFWSGSRKKKNRSLYRIWTKSSPVPGWAKMSIANEQQLYKHQAIQSISEFSAIDGGIPSFMLSNLGPVTWAIVTMHFASEIQCNDQVFQWDIADGMEITGVCGLVMIGVFELDPYNPSMKFFHYVGAGSGTGTVIGYLIQQVSLSVKGGVHAFRLVTPIVLCVTCFTSFFLWRVFNKQTSKYEAEIREKYANKKPTTEENEEIRDKITAFSLKNVISEGIFLFMGATALALWLTDYHRNCDVGCAGPIGDE